MIFPKTLFSITAIVYSQISFAATIDDHLTCALMYGSLFEAAKNSQHSAMIAYTRPRLQAILPFMEANRNNPDISSRLKIVATNLEGDVNVLNKQVIEAIKASDVDKLKIALVPVFHCDKIFGVQSFPLPLSSDKPFQSNQFAMGFYEGCLAKNRKNPGSFKDSQILKYCNCMTDSVIASEISAQSSESELGRVIGDVHGECLRKLQ